jgi:hypothetical protein
MDGWSPGPTGRRPQAPCRRRRCLPLGGGRHPSARMPRGAGHVDRAVPTATALGQAAVSDDVEAVSAVDSQRPDRGVRPRGVRDLVCESGRVHCEIGFPRLDRAKAATVNFAAITSPVLAIAGGCDRLVPARIARQTAGRYQKGTYVEIPEPTISSLVGRRYRSPWATSTTGSPESPALHRLTWTDWSPERRATT